MEGDSALLERLGEAISRALAGRRRMYRVRVDSVGRCGEVLVSVDGTRGRLPLLFSQDDEPAFVASTVLQTVERFAL
jgi:hypothetical protein